VVTATSVRARPNRCAARRASHHHRDRPDLRAPSGDDGFQVTTLEEALPYADIVITATGNKDIVTVAHMQMMKHQAILGNIGHFDNEIDIAGLTLLPGVKRENIKPQVTSGFCPTDAPSSFCPRADCSIWVTRPDTRAS